MKKYASFFRIRFTTGLQYRIAAYAGIATQFAWGFMEVLMFRAFYRADAAAFPMSFSQLSSYIWLQQAFLALFMTWFFDNDIFASITGGNIAYELVRPMDLYGMWFVKNLASRLSKAVLRCMPILVVAAFLPVPYKLLLPVSFPSFLVFLFSMLLGFCMVVAFGMLIPLCFRNPYDRRFADGVSFRSGCPSAVFTGQYPRNPGASAVCIHAESAVFDLCGIYFLW